MLMVPNEIEILTVADRYNEYIMTGLHLGCFFERIKSEFDSLLGLLLKQADKFLKDELLSIKIIF
jgi:oxygen-independent coproporphyrinogen-3 oxidase